METPQISTSATLGRDPELWTIKLNGESITATMPQLIALRRIINATIKGGN